MNRTLKFKIWCANQNYFEYINLYEDNFNYDKYVNPKIYQFTGLTDSYGNDIYEGDIIEIEGSFQKWIVKYEIDKFITEAVSKNFILHKSNLSDFLNLNIFNSKVKIIGHIIENPDIKTDENVHENITIPSFVDLDSLLDNLSIYQEKQ